MICFHLNLIAMVKEIEGLPIIVRIMLQCGDQSFLHIIERNQFLRRRKEKHFDHKGTLIYFIVIGNNDRVHILSPLANVKVDTPSLFGTPFNFKLRVRFSIALRSSSCISH